MKQLEICENNTCENFEEFRDSFTFYRWDKLFDFSFILNNIKIIHREDLIPENFFSKLNITNDNNEQVWKISSNSHINSFHDDKISNNISLPGEAPNKISLIDLRQ